MSKESMEVTEINAESEVDNGINGLRKEDSFMIDFFYSVAMKIVSLFCFYKG